MDPKPTSSSSPAENDVLRPDPNHSTLSAEEIAKAIAHHNKNHPGNKVQAAPAQSGSGGSGKSGSGNRKR